MRIRLGFAVFILMPLVGLSQVSPVQDSDGKTSILYGDKTNVNFNFSDSKISFGSDLIKLSDIANKKHPSYLGFQGSFKTADGLSKVLSKGKLTPEGNVGITYTYYTKEVGKDTAGLRWFYVTLNQGFANYKFFDNVPNPDKLIVTKPEYYTTITLGLNKDTQKNWAWGTGIQTILGNNNYGSLDEYTIATSNLVNGSSSSSIITSNTENVRGRYDQYAGNFADCSILGDLLYWPNNWQGKIMLGAHSVINFNEIRRPSTNFRFGVYFTHANNDKDNKDESDPTSVRGGLVFETNDIFGARSEKPFIERCLINLVVGYTIKSN